MEHIVQFGICIDDEVIKRNIEKTAEKQVATKIKEDVMRELIGKAEYSAFEYSNKIKEIIIDTTNVFLTENKNEIIKLASDKIAEKLVRTKAIKSALEDIITG